MGNSHSQTNLGWDCTTIHTSENDSSVYWGDSIRVSMSKTTDRKSQLPRWSASYQVGENSCGFDLKIQNQVLQLDLGDLTGNVFGLTLKIEWKGASGGLVCDLDGSLGRQFFSANDFENYSIETNIMSYRCSDREGLFVVEKKKHSKYENPYLVTLAHYYISQDVGFSAVAEVHDKRSGFGVEVKGPYEHPAKDLRMVIVQTCSSRIWKPTACPHCYPTAQPQPNGNASGLMPQFLISNPGNANGTLNGSFIKAEKLIIRSNMAAPKQHEPDQSIEANPRPNRRNKKPAWFNDFYQLIK